MRRYAALAMTGVMALTLLTGCASPQKAAENDTTAAPQTEAQGAETKTESEPNAGAADGTREVVNYWHIHTGDEAKVEDDLIAAYNASQDKYEVVGLSMND